MYIDNELFPLRARLLERIGSTTLHPGDCSKISVAIFLETGHYVSETTIKRIFGVAPLLNESSNFVKDALSNFLGFSNWKNLKSNFHLVKNESP